MKINEALPFTGKVRRVGWDKDVYARLVGALSFTLYKVFDNDEEQLYGGQVTLVDIMAEDWEPVYDLFETFNTIEIMRELADGTAKIVKRLDNNLLYKMTGGQLYPTTGGDGCRGPSALSLTLEVINARWVIVQ